MAILLVVDCGPSSGLAWPGLSSCAALPCSIPEMQGIYQEVVCQGCKLCQASGRPFLHAKVAGSATQVVFFLVMLLIYHTLLLCRASMSCLRPVCVSASARFFARQTSVCCILHSWWCPAWRYLGVCFAVMRSQSSNLVCGRQSPPQVILKHQRVHTW